MIAPFDKRNGRIEKAARLAAERDRKFRDDPEPTVASRLGQIGVLGWAIVAPILLGVVVGRWLDADAEDRNFLHRSADHAGSGGGPVDRLAMDAPAMTHRRASQSPSLRARAWARPISRRCGGASP